MPIGVETGLVPGGAACHSAAMLGERNRSLPKSPSGVSQPGSLHWWRETATLIHAAARGDESPQAAVTRLSRGLGFDAALLTVADPADPARHRVVANADYPTSVVHYMASDYVADCPGFRFAQDTRVAARICDTPFDFRETRTYLEHLGPAGFNEGVTLVMEIPWARTTGMLAMSSANKAPMDETTRLGLTLLGSELATLVSSPLPELMDDFDNGDLVVEVASQGNLVWLSGSPDECNLSVETVHQLARHVRVGRRRRAGGFHRDSEGTWWRLRAAQRSTAHNPGAVVVHLSRQAPFGGLTARELQVLGLVAQGLTNNEIAEALAISLRTVKAHLEALLLKLAQTNRSGLVRITVEQDLWCLALQG